VKVNRTPSDIPDADRQAMIPTIHADADGRLAVTYFDFRRNGTGPGTPTDLWAISCAPDADCTEPGEWSEETRLTDSSFDLQKAPELTSGIFLGDYMGRGSARDAFFSLFVMPTPEQPRGTGQTGVFLRRFGPAVP
jgi:hypothetical protein